MTFPEVTTRTRGRGSPPTRPPAKRDLVTLVEGERDESLFAKGGVVGEGRCHGVSLTHPMVCICRAIKGAVCVTHDFGASERDTTVPVERRGRDAPGGHVRSWEDPLRLKPQQVDSLSPVCSVENKGQYDQSVCS